MLFKKEWRRETKTTDVHCRNKAKDMTQAFPKEAVKHLLRDHSMHSHWVSSLCIADVAQSKEAVYL